MAREIQQRRSCDLARASLWQGYCGDLVRGIQNIPWPIWQRAVPIRLSGLAGQSVVIESDARVVLPALAIRIREHAWNILDAAPLADAAAHYRRRANISPSRSGKHEGHFRFEA